ncbi:MAG: M14 family zinc carboxypeptidase [Paracoccaceae bacterium]
MAYLNIEEIDTGVRALAQAYPSDTTLIDLPQRSVEGRNIRALSLGADDATERPTLVLVGGLHAREWVPPDALLYLAADLLEARDNGTGLSYGDCAFSHEVIGRICRTIRLVVLPCANPDGRHFSQTQEALWRKNRSFNDGAGHTCRGVDLNRNFDVAWDFKRKFADGFVSASDDPCHPSVYVGRAPASEPETQNVVWLLDENPETRWYIDVHSAIPSVFHGWGLDENQSDTPEMHFLNPAFDGARGASGDSYGEFIEAADAHELDRLARVMATEIERVHGDRYDVSQAFTLYATSGASDDYAYSRHLQQENLGKILGFTMECGHEFQPDFETAIRVMEEVAAAILAFADDVSQLADATG